MFRSSVSVFLAEDRGEVGVVSDWLIERAGLTDQERALWELRRDPNEASWSWISQG